MPELKRDNDYFMFVYDLALELANDARQAFLEAGCDDMYKSHFMADLAQALTAEARRKG